MDIELKQQVWHIGAATMHQVSILVLMDIELKLSEGFILDDVTWMFQSLF